MRGCVWFIWLRIGTALGSYEHGNKTWGCIMKLTFSIRHQPRASEPEAKRRGCGNVLPDQSSCTPQGVVRDE
jgi:hypothetical protein